MTVCGGVLKCAPILPMTFALTHASPSEIRYKKGRTPTRAFSSILASQVCCLARPTHVKTVAGRGFFIRPSVFGFKLETPDWSHTVVALQRRPHGRVLFGSVAEAEAEARAHINPLAGQTCAEEIEKVLQQICYPG